jgi:hypothetical protein
MPPLRCLIADFQLSFSLPLCHIISFFFLPPFSAAFAAFIIDTGRHCLPDIATAFSRFRFR